MQSLQLAIKEYDERKSCNTSLFNKILQGHEMQSLMIILKYFYFNIISDQNFHKLTIFIAKFDFQK